MLMVKRIYIFGWGRAQNPVFFYEKSAASLFHLLHCDTRTTFDDPGVKTVQQVDTQIALAVVQDDFEITAAVTAPNTLNSMFLNPITNSGGFIGPS